MISIVHNDRIPGETWNAFSLHIDNSPKEARLFLFVFILHVDDWCFARDCMEHRSALTTRANSSKQGYLSKDTAQNKQLQEMGASAYQTTR